MDGILAIPPVLLAVRDPLGYWDFAWVYSGSTADASNAATLGPRISVAEELLYAAFKGGPWAVGKEAEYADGILHVTDGGITAVYRLGERNACSMTYDAEWPD
jgi:hypothetical protein